MRRPLPFKEQVEVNAQIDRTNFGRNLLDAVEIQMKAGGAIETLVSMLNDLKTQLEEDQANADDSYTETTRIYNETKVSVQAQIDSTKIELNAANVEVETNTASRDQYAEQVENFTESLRETKSFLEKTNALRKEQNLLFLRRKSEHETAIEAVALARTKTSQLYGAYDSTNDQTTLIQSNKPLRSQILVEVQNHLEAAAKIHKFGAIIKLLQQVAQPDRPVWTDSRGTINRLDDLLTELDTLLRDALASFIESENTAQGAYDTLAASLKQEIESITGDLAVATEQRDYFSAQVTIWTGARDNLIIESANLEAEFRANEAGQADVERDYREASQNRNEELDIINEVIEIVTTRLSSVKSYLSDRVDSRV